MAFGDFIRAVKADLKHDDSIVEDYDWDRFIGFKKFDINRFDELLEIIENLSVNERFSSLHKFPVKEDGNAFDWNMEKTPFYNGAVKGLGLSHMIPFYMTSITHKLVDAKSIATTFSMVQMSFNYDNQHFLTYEEDKAIVLSFIVEYITFFVEDFEIPITILLKEVRRNMLTFLRNCIIYSGKMIKLKISSMRYTLLLWIPLMGEILMIRLLFKPWVVQLII